MILDWLDVVVPFLAVGVFLLDTGGLIETVLLLLVTELVGSGLDIVSVQVRSDDIQYSLYQQKELLLMPSDRPGKATERMHTASHSQSSMHDCLLTGIFLPICQWLLH